MSTPEILSFAVCLFDYVQLLDYSGPMDLLGFLDNTSRDDPKRWARFSPPPKAIFEFTYLAPSRESVNPTSGPAVTPTLSYDEALASGKQFDVLLVPGGRGVRPDNTPESLMRFIQAQFTGAKYVLSVCTGSWALAQAGVIDGRRATTNKASFRTVVQQTAYRNIDWVPKARWVVDGGFWSASGVSAGIDMTVAWLKHVLGEQLTLEIQGIVEVSSKEEGDDEWAGFHGLVPR